MDLKNEKTPPELIGHQLGKREAELSFAPTANKVRKQPILKSKITVMSDNPGLVEVANGISAQVNCLKEKNVYVNENQPIVEKSKIPKPLQKVRLKERQRSHASQSVLAEGERAPFSTVVLSKGFEMKRVDVEDVQLPKENKSKLVTNLKDGSRRLNRKSVKLEIPVAKSNISVSKGKSSASAPSSKTDLENSKIPEAIKSFKTLQEFLDMPPVNPLPANKDTEETNVNVQKTESDNNNNEDPEKPTPNATAIPLSNITSTAKTKVASWDSKSKAEQEKPTQYYKSKFWEYVTPSKTESTARGVERAKPYDPAVVKSFMEKQSKQRRQKQEELERERKEKQEKRHQMLVQLSEKCKMARKSPMKPKRNSAVTSQVNIRRRAMDELQWSARNESPTVSASNFYTARKTYLASTTSQSATTTPPPPPHHHQKFSTTLLNDFESRVKRECINCFDQTNRTLGRREGLAAAAAAAEKPMVDKAVETGESLKGSSRSTPTSLSLLKRKGNVLECHMAASKIQAAYKGFTVRKLMCGAYPRENEDLSQARRQLCNVKVSRKAFQLSNKVPETPCDSSRERPKSKIPELYVPPSVSWVGGEIPTLLLCSAKRPKKRSFDEPYPADEILKRQEAAAEAEISISRRNSLSDFIKCGLIPELHPGKSTGLSQSPAIAKILKGSSKKTDLLASSPSITSALYEKLRLLEQKDQKAGGYKEASFSLESPVQSQSGVRAKLSSSPFGSVSTISGAGAGAQSGTVSHSQDVSLTDDQFGSADEEALQRTSTPVKVSAEEKVEAGESSLSSSKTSAVETDANLLPNVQLVKKPREEKEESSTTGSSSCSTVTTPFALPAIKLQFEAERERLSMLNKMLRAKKADLNSSQKGSQELTALVKMAVDAAEKKISQQIQEFEREQLAAVYRNSQEKFSSNLDNIQLEIIKCQQQAVKSTAEISKWMAELKKSSVQEAQIQANCRPAEMATLVCSAVDEAMRILEEQRQQRAARKRPEHENANALLDSLLGQKLATPPTAAANKCCQFPSRSEATSAAEKTHSGRSGRSSTFAADSSEKEDELGSAEKELSSTDDDMKAKECSLSQEKIESESPSTENDIGGSSYHQQKFDETQSKVSYEKGDNVTGRVKSCTFEVESSSAQAPDEEILEQTEKSQEKSFETPYSSEPTSEEIHIESKFSNEKIEGIDSEKGEKEMMQSDVLQPGSNQDCHKLFQQPKPQLLSITDTEIEESSFSEVKEDDESDNVEESENNTSQQLASYEKVEFSEETAKSLQASVVKSDEAPAVNLGEVIANGNISDSVRKSEIPTNVVDDAKLVTTKEIEDIEQAADDSGSKKTVHEIEEEIENDSELASVNEEKLSSQILEEEQQQINPENISRDSSFELEKNDSDILENHEKLASQRTDVESSTCEKYSGMENSALEDNASEKSHVVSSGGKIIFSDDFESEAESQEESVNEENPKNEQISPERPAQVDGLCITNPAEKIESNEIQTSERSGEKSSPQSTETEIEEIFEEDFEDESEKTKAPNAPPTLLDNPEAVDGEKDRSFSDLEGSEGSVEEGSECKQSSQKIPQGEVLIEELTNEEAEEEEEEEEAAPPSPIASYLSALERQQRGPPPPYSPPTSDSLSLKSFSLAVEESQVKSVVTKCVDEIWQDWESKGSFAFSPPSHIGETEGGSTGSVGDWASSSFDKLLRDVAQETILGILGREGKRGLEFVDQVRCGSLAVEAKRQRLPRSKSQLVTQVFSHMLTLMPSAKMMPDGARKKLPAKWSCRPRDVVESILVQELVAEDVRWTELWPEQLLVTQQLSEKLLKDAVRSVLGHVNSALSARHTTTEQ